MRVTTLLAGASLAALMMTAPAPAQTAVGGGTAQDAQSVAVGPNTLARGGSVAMGGGGASGAPTGPRATGDNSIAIGMANTRACAQDGVAVGRDAGAASAQGIAIGECSQAGDGRRAPRPYPPKPALRKASVSASSRVRARLSSR